MSKIEKRDLEVHPILLQDSKGHYDIEDGVSNIIEFEMENTIQGGFGAISYNIIKYKNRKKGQDELDNKKIETFIAWRELLSDLLELGYDRSDNLRYVMKVEYPNIRYSL